jgi:hypothetical protein
MEERQMQNWQKTRNYRKFENSDGSFTYTINVDGEKVEVSKELYEVYAGAERKLEYMELDLKRDRVFQDADGKAVRDENGQPIVLPEREVSLEKLIDEDWDYPSAEALPEDEVAGRLEIKDLRRYLGLLTNSERELVAALFFEGLTEREYAKQLGISKTALHARKIKVLDKLKIFLSEQ